jgi:endonuclease/exonuclease/phosphatase family metal-dependent hydrolase
MNSITWWSERRCKAKSWKVLWLTLLTMAVVGCSAVPVEKIRPRFTKAELSSVIRIGTYNVFTGGHDFRQTVAVIRKMDADVVAMQEIAPRSAVMLDRELRRDYAHRYFSNGLGIVSRFPLHNPRFLRSERGINGFLLVEIDHPKGRMQIANLHLDPLRLWTTQDRLTLPIQLLWRQGVTHRDEVKQVMRNLRPDLPTVLLGDFNSTNHASARLSSLGFTDSFAAVTRKPGRSHTLHFSVLGFRTGRRIDFIFHDRAFETIESRVLPGKPSDHDPVISALRYDPSPMNHHEVGAGLGDYGWFRGVSLVNSSPDR